MIHFTATRARFASPNERLRHERLAVLRACPIDFVDGLLPAGAPDASAVSSCYGDMLIGLASSNPPRGWVLTTKGQRQLTQGH